MEPIPFKIRETDKTLAVFDSETDPFAPGRKVLEMFTCGFLNLETGDYLDWWSEPGSSCLDQFVTWLCAETAAGRRYIIYCHNFGGFDAHLGLLDFMDTEQEPSIINGRLSVVTICGQEWRDSYRIFPEALSAYAKDSFDYDKMEREVRQDHKAEILLYQRHDCEYLADLVREFWAMFGDRPTIGNTAMGLIQSMHPFERMNRGDDAKARPFYAGGRCQVFLSGVHRGAWEVHDVNGMYSSVMKDFRHPISASAVVSQKLWPITAFVEWEGENSGCMLTRSEDGSLSFNETSGRFLSTRHEIEVGEASGTIKIRRIIKSLGYREWGSMGDFVDFCNAKKIEAENNGDKPRRSIWKRVGNSGYGKYGQDPSRYERYAYSHGADGIPERLLAADDPYGFGMRFINGDRIIWGRPSPSRNTGFFNVATGASITGAARAQLFRGLLAAKRAAYCDTDSIVCEGFRSEGLARNHLDFDPQRLGAWKLEARGDLWACAGKKLYALFSSDPGDRVDDKGAARERVSFEGANFWCVKKASKGANLTAGEILKVALGGRVKYISDRPNFKLDGTVEFVERWIERTD